MIRVRLLPAVIALTVFVNFAAAQDSSSSRSAGSPPIPAREILSARAELGLTDAQVAKLKTLETAQVAALNKATAAFLRAEADLLDARRDDLAQYRLGLEKRAKVAIDAEIVRLQAEKDSRAVLTADQRSRLGAMSFIETDRSTSDVVAWQAVVAPPPLTRVMRQAESPDSVEVRISVAPTYADIYLDGTKVGSGRKFLHLSLGSHTILLHAAGCTDVIYPLMIERGPPVLVPTQKLICTESMSREY
jgi:Spy/CpxP family protein refolding chaperone